MVNKQNSVLIFLQLCGLVFSFEYDDAVYDTLLKYSYISKLSYCIDEIKPDHILADPIELDLNPISFLQSGYHSDDHYETAGKGKIELHVAKMIYSDVVKKKSQQEDDDEFGHSEGFFSVEHVSEEENDDGAIILTFKGKTTSEDYLSEINLNLIDYKPLTQDAQNVFDCHDCKIHKSTFERFKTLEEDVFHGVELLTETFPDYKLIITGHSTGGSLAMIAGLELSLLGYNPLVVSYGNPKIFNRALSDYVDKLLETETVFKQVSAAGNNIEKGLLRAVHQGDYIPLLPPGSQFVQPGLELLIEKNELPHPKSVVTYRGKANNLVHDVGFSVWDIFSFNLGTIFHYDQHLHYFYDFQSCGEEDNSSRKINSNAKDSKKQKLLNLQKDVVADKDFGALPNW
ncbi:hypothetical protein WICPIJ_006276 [Wickerhamomyces pijperi]|uniref:triacylglycerol lipase n=1 Tax=Wickerhamomyces pijperi TaxID=599730 RepID=A0A9P8TL05_WICPI|nr:hypothetical protein WICPIJ_006276 [Wickerhamomyces pijperi]